MLDYGQIIFFRDMFDAENHSNFEDNESEEYWMEEEEWENETEEETAAAVDAGKNTDFSSKQEKNEEYQEDAIDFQKMQFTKIEIKPLRVEINTNDRNADGYGNSREPVFSAVKTPVDIQKNDNYKPSQILEDIKTRQDDSREILRKYIMSDENKKITSGIEAFIKKKSQETENDALPTDKNTKIQALYQTGDITDYDNMGNQFPDYYKTQSPPFFSSNDYFPEQENFILPKQDFFTPQNIRSQPNNSLLDDYPYLKNQRYSIENSDRVITPSASPQTIMERLEIPPNQQKTTPTAEDRMIFSDALTSSTILPVDVLDDRYTKIDKNKCCSLGVFATNSDLKQLCMMRPDMESLSISNCNMIYEFDCIKKLQYLKEFEARNCQLLTSLDCIAEARELRVLNIASSGVTNIDAVANLKNLEVLNCAACKITEIKALKYCPKLIEVVLWGCMSVSDIDSLGFCQNLRCLDLEFTGVSDLFPLVNNRKLEFLDLDVCEKIKDLAPLTALHNLKILTMEGNSIIMERQLENISGLRELKYLNLKDRKINNSSLFEGLTNLEELNLAGSTFSNVSPLAKLINLTVLDLSANSSIKNISSLCTLSKIKKFLIGGGGNIRGLRDGDKFAAGKSQMEIEDVDVIGNFTKMVIFNTSNNPKIKNIDAIKNCKDMEEVYLARCIGLEDVTALGSLMNLNKIDLTSCPKIKELYFLSNLPKLLSLMFNGTIVYSPSFLSNWKKATGMFELGGNDSDMLSKNFLVSARKKVKLQKMLKTAFAVKNN
jgi:hypothetical protein